MDIFLVNKDRYFKEHNIKAEVKSGDILAPKQVTVLDILLGNKQDKLVNNMSDIFPQTYNPDA